MKPVAELIAVPGKSFPALVFADGFRDLPAGTKLYAGTAINWDALQKNVVIPTWRERLCMLDKPTDFAIGMAAKMEAAELRREIVRLKSAIAGKEK